MNTAIRDVPGLVEAIAAGWQPKYLFFWGHKPRVAGQVDQVCFSQWWPATFDVDGARYRTAEHWLMAEKARLFGDEAVRQEILQVEHPGAAKKLGRTVQQLLHKQPPCCAGRSNNKGRHLLFLLR